MPYLVPGAAITLDLRLDFRFRREPVIYRIAALETTALGA